MNQDILLSKIVPNATETTWAQAYTTLNVYITLSIEKETARTSVTPFGKELLEKLQREFFALDDKSLENIKKAVGNVSKTIDSDYRYSILVGAIVSDVLYIVIASTGQVVIKREEQTGIIATGVENELHGFSGKLKHNDIILFETGDFNEKIPLDSLSEYLSSKDVLQIAENITPLVHENSKGTESAIIIQYKDMKRVVDASDDSEFKENEEKEEGKQQEETEEGYIPENLWTKERHENRNIEELNENENTNEEEIYEEPQQKPRFKLPSINFANRRTILLVVCGVLILILVGGVLFQINQKNQSKKTAEFNKIYTPIQRKFDEGTKLESLNKSLALDDFAATSKMIDSALAKYSKGSSEYNKLSQLKSESESKISEMAGGSSAKNVKEFLKPGSEIKSITAVSAKGGTLVLLDSKGQQAATIDTDGTIKKTYDIKSGDKFISSDDKFIYTMGTGITSIDRGNGKVTNIIKSATGDAFDIFGSNVYTLTNGDILKYKAPSYDPNSYFTDKPSFKNNPIDMSISGPIWVLEEGGTIERFTKGKNDNIELSGLEGPIAGGGKIYADSDNQNVYIMDVKNQRVVVFNDKGEYQTQYEGSFIKDATSFAIDEKNKIGYVVSKNVLYSFDL